MALRGLLSHCNLAESLLLSDPSNLESYKELPSKEAIICASNQSKLILFHIFSYPFKVNSIKGFVPNGYISPRSALAHSDDRNAIIFFPASKGLFLSNSDQPYFVCLLQGCNVRLHLVFGGVLRSFFLYRFVFHGEYYTKFSI